MALLNYTKVEFADSYLKPLQNDKWNNADASEKERLLILASRYINQNFRLVDFEGEIPQKVQEATCEVALALAEGQNLLNSVIKDAPLEELKADVVTLKFSKDNLITKPVLPAVEALLKDYLLKSKSTFQSIKLIRS